MSVSGRQSAYSCMFHALPIGALARLSGSSIGRAGGVGPPVVYEVCYGVVGNNNEDVQVAQSVVLAASHGACHPRSPSTAVPSNALLIYA